MKQKICPVCDQSINADNIICSTPRCGWDFSDVIGTPEKSGALLQQKLSEAKAAWKRFIDERHRQDMEIQALLGEQLNKDLPYYDFILLGHSSVGKTTYLTMLCDQGGDKNQTWNFKSGGSALYLGNNTPESIRNSIQEGNNEIINLIRRVSTGTQAYIRLIRDRIRKQDGNYSTVKDNKLIFSFRPTKVKHEHTLLTLDYPGEWISLDNKKSSVASYQGNIEKITNYLNMTQSLIIMIDPLIFLEDDIDATDFHSQGLAEIQNKLRESAITNRPKEFIPINNIPVALVINKSDLLKVAFDNKKISKNYLINDDPRAFLEDNCRNIYNALNQFTTNWKPFFVSCYGYEYESLKVNEQGAYKPPSDPKPVNLEKPLDWLYHQAKNRKNIGILRKITTVATVYLVLPLIIMFVMYYGTYYSVQTWDSNEFSLIEKKEPTYLDKPNVLYDEYTDYDNSYLHWLSSWTGFKDKVHEKRKIFVELYLNTQLGGVLKTNISTIEDFQATRTQVRKWSEELKDKEFAEKMESIMSEELMPLYAKKYYELLNTNFLQSKDIKEGFAEFVKLFPNSPYIKNLEEIDNEIWALELYKKIYQMVNSQTQDFKSKKLLQLCLEYLNTTKKHSLTYKSSVQTLIIFIEETLATAENNELLPRSFRIEYKGYTLSESMYGQHTEDYQEPYESCYTDTSGWSNKQRCSTAYKTAQRTVKTAENVIIGILIDGIEKYSLDTSTKIADSFSIDWMPGMAIEVVVNNTTGKSTKIKDSSLLAINFLKGNLNVNGEASVNFGGSELSIPKLQEPSVSMPAKP